MVKTLTLLLIITFYKKSYSQEFEFSHSLGLSAAAFVKYNYFNIEPCIQYNARLDYVIQDNFSVSLSSFPSISVFSFVDDKARFILPLGLQLNLGNHASQYSSSLLGYYIHTGVCDFALSDEYLEIKPFFSLGFEISRTTLKADFIPVFKEENASHIINLGILIHLNKGTPP